VNSNKFLYMSTLNTDQVKSTISDHLARRQNSTFVVQAYAVVHGGFKDQLDTRYMHYQNANIYFNDLMDFQSVNYFKMSKHNHVVYHIKYLKVV